MRIIGGAFRGRRLHAPRSGRIRPTLDSVRESVFNMIAGEIAGSRVLDLFAGTGAMGLEALSRGALFCVFVDKSREAARLLNANIQLCAVQEISRIIREEAAHAIRRLEAENELFDLIFLDPPYGEGYVEKTLQIVGAVARSDALVIAERCSGEKLIFPVSAWRNERERRYGDTLISVYSRLAVSY